MLHNISNSSEYGTYVHIMYIQGVRVYSFLPKCWVSKPRKWLLPCKRHTCGMNILEHSHSVRVKDNGIFCNVDWLTSIIERTLWKNLQGLKVKHRWMRQWKNGDETFYSSSNFVSGRKKIQRSRSQQKLQLPFAFNQKT
jgi:hypothetical protein